MDAVKIDLPNFACDLITEMATDSPAILALIRRLPPVTQPLCQHADYLLSRFLERMLWLPRVNLNQAEVILDHAGSPDGFADEELTLMESSSRSGWRRQYRRWQAVWELAEADQVRSYVRYAAALAWRLYRLESQAMKEADAL